ncbi:hypothetical protein Apmu_0248_02 [Acidiphilium multivorum AIU301]|jgi:uncharacterized protein (DUF983 family)|nr:hypothetical protein Apmu_0248_02 [Acidiphilium multivorum AIU301]
MDDCHSEIHAAETDMTQLTEPAASAPGMARRPRARLDVPWTTVLGRGLAMRCPSCGERPAFDGYLHVRPHCEACGAPLGRVPCDDAPPYLTLVVVLHVVVAAAVILDRGGRMPSSTLLEIFLPLTLALILLLLRPIKGATLGVLLKVGILRPAPAATGAGSAGA